VACGSPEIRRRNGTAWISVFFDGIDHEDRIDGFAGALDHPDVMQALRRSSSSKAR